MQNFTFYSPTQVVFGRGTQRQTAELIAANGGTRVLVLTGGESARRSGLLDEIEAVLRVAGLLFKGVGGVRPNPRLRFAEAAVDEALGFGADFILAVGGGSVIDTAKAVAHGAANPGVPLWDFWCGKAKLERTLPVGCVLTIPAAGSETSNSAVLTNEASGQKRGLSTDLNRPRFAVMNPELTLTLPPYQVGCGVVDIMMHTLDRYFTHTEGNETTDALAEALLRVTIRNGAAAIQNPRDYGAMSELMWCGSLSHNQLTGLGAQTDFAVHQLGHELSARFDVAHGASLSAVWGDWARYVVAKGPERFARYAEQVWQVREGGAAARAEEGIARTTAYFRSLGMPTSLCDLGIGPLSEASLRELADRCAFGGARTIGAFQVLEREDIYRIYAAANH